MRRCMKRDFSWDVSAREYASLYNGLLKPATGKIAAA